jgi:hypothetical protein
MPWMFISFRFWKEEDGRDVKCGGGERVARLCWLGGGIGQDRKDRLGQGKDDAHAITITMSGKPQRIWAGKRNIKRTVHSITLPSDTPA